jgi:hypothetical protein
LHSQFNNADNLLSKYRHINAPIPPKNRSLGRKTYLSSATNTEKTLAPTPRLTLPLYLHRKTVILSLTRIAASHHPCGNFKQRPLFRKFILAPYEPIDLTAL